MAKKNSLWKAVAAVSAIMLCGGIGYLLYFHMTGRMPLSGGMLSDLRNIPTQRGGPVSVENGQSKETSDIYLYFADEKGLFLKSEKSVINRSEDPTEMGRAIVEDLIRGPKGDLVRTIPPGTTLNAVYVSQDGTVFVDFSDAIRENHPGGSRTELLTVYSIVNSLALNIPEVNRVKILINGSETMTIAGHIDSRFPFQANMILVR